MSLVLFGVSLKGYGLCPRSSGSNSKLWRDHACTQFPEQTYTRLIKARLWPAPFHETFSAMPNADLQIPGRIIKRYGLRYLNVVI